MSRPRSGFSWCSRALLSAGILASNYVFVMWNRAALMEPPKTAFIVASWYCYTRAEQSAVMDRSGRAAFSFGPWCR